MTLSIKSRVSGNYLEIMRRFDRDLFEFLLPKQGEVRIKEFTGSETGDRVHLEFLRPFKATWISHITEHGSDDEKAYFVDRGVELPFGLKYWRHEHIVWEDGKNRSVIEDKISYKFGNAVFTLLLFPVVYMGFLPRRKQYRRYFGA